jgi:hypothetical protein
MMALAKGTTGRGCANDRARDILSHLIKRSPPGKKYVIEYLTGIINVPDTRRSFSSRRTGRLLQERSDVRLISPGVWMVVK